MRLCRDWPRKREKKNWERLVAPSNIVLRGKYFWALALSNAPMTSNLLLNISISVTLTFSNGDYIKWVQFHSEQRHSHSIFCVVLCNFTYLFLEILRIEESGNIGTDGAGWTRVSLRRSSAEIYHEAVLDLTTGGTAGAWQLQYPTHLQNAHLHSPTGIYIC